MFAVFTVSAQRNSHGFKDFGKIDKSEFQPTDFDDLGYNAVILFAEKKVYFETYNNSLRLFHRVHLRLKVLQDGFSDSDLFTITYSGLNSYERVPSWKLSVFTLNGDKIVNTKVKYKQSHSIDKDSLNSFFTFDLPVLKRGDIIDFQYYIATYDFMLPPAYDFKYKYPALKAEFVAEFPVHMKYKYTVNDPENQVYHSSENSFLNIPYLFAPNDNPKSFYYMQGRGRRFNLNFKFQCDIDTFRVSHILPQEVADNPNFELTYPRVVMKAAKFTQNIGYSHPIYMAAWQQMTHLLYTYADPDNRYLSESEAWFKLYDAGYIIVNSNSWQLLHKQLRKSPDFWKPVMKVFPVDKTLQDIFDEAEFSDTLQTVNKIYQYVNKNVTWDSTYCNHLSKNPEKVLKTKIGSTADINLTLVALLRRAGLDAFPALTATKDYGVVDTSYANKIQFNNVLAVLRLNDSNCIVMDCSQKNNPYNQLPLKDLNNFCYAVAPEDGFFIELNKN